MILAAIVTIIIYVRRRGSFGRGRASSLWCDVGGWCLIHRRPALTVVHGARCLAQASAQYFTVAPVIVDGLLAL